MSELMTVRQVATQLQVTTKRVYQLCAAGKVESCRLGPRQIRVTRASVEQLVEKALKHERRELCLDWHPPK